MIPIEELHSIGQAALLSGVPVETIRIWERRYKAVEPVRTTGGHRKYTENDVRYLAALKSLVASGTRIGKAAKMPKKDVLSVNVTPSPTSEHEGGFEALTKKIIIAARDLRSDEVAALLKIKGDHQAFDVVTGCYLPLLREIGVLWHAGEVSVAVEHMVENAVSSEIQSLMRTTPSNSDGPIAVCAAIEGDRHEVGLLTATLFLQKQGIRTVYLGGDLPLTDLDDAVRRVRPDLVVISAMLSPQEEQLQRLERLAKKSHFSRAAKVMGGPGLGDKHRLPSFTYCPTLIEFSEKIPQLLEEFCHLKCTPEN